MNISLYRNRLIADVKAYIRLFLSIGLYYTGIINLIRYIKKRDSHSNGIIILAYHDISDKDYLDLHVPPGVFRSHVKYLIEQGYNIISLAEALNLLQSDGKSIPDNSVVITFDDVYSGFYRNLFPIVKQFEIPVTIFVCTEPVEKRIPPFVDALIYALDNTSREKIDLTSYGLESYRLSSKLLKENAIYKINEYSKEMNLKDRGSLLAYVFDLLGVSFPSQELNKEVLTWDEIVEMGRNSLVEFGAHTMNHPSLSRIPLDQVRDEVRGSTSCIEQKLNTSIHSFAYPYGSVNDINENVRGIVKEEGMSCGCTLSRGMNRKGDDLYLLKRICMTNQVKPKLFRVFSKAVFAFHMMKL